MGEMESAPDASLVRRAPAGDTEAAYAPSAGLNSGYGLGVNLVSVRYNYVLTRVEFEAVLGRDL